MRAFAKGERGRSCVLPFAVWPITVRSFIDLDSTCRWYSFKETGKASSRQPCHSRRKITKEECMSLLLWSSTSLRCLGHHDGEAAK